MVSKKRQIKSLTLSEAQNMFEYDKASGEMWRIKKDGSKQLLSKVSSQGYIHTTVRSKPYGLHRLAFMLEGIDPKGSLVDHIDGDKLNNKRDNLRLVSHTENTRNRALGRNNNGGVFGVYLKGEKWIAMIGVDDKLVHLGVFEKRDDAIAARKAGELKYGFHKNHGREQVDVAA